MIDEEIKFISDIFKTPILNSGGCGCTVIIKAGTFVCETLDVPIEPED